MYTPFKFVFSFILLSGFGSGSFININDNVKENVDSFLKVTNQTVLIVGGEEAELYEFPWQIRIQWKSNKGLLCGGTIIDNSTILTAAHCISSTPPGVDIQRYEVLAGAHNMYLAENDSRQTRNIRKINCHQGYNSNNYQNDICILKLESNLIWTTAVKPIPLSSTSPPIPGTGIVTGWGLTMEEGLPSAVLRKVTVPLVNHAECARIYEGHITNSMFCAGVGGKDSCQGDSGGPFICSFQGNPFLCGVVSFGVGCARPGIPGVYTQVSSYRQWIEDNSDGNQTGGSSINLPSALILLSFVMIGVLFVYE